MYILDKQPVFVCGMPKSGTILFMSLLDGHIELLVFPEQCAYLKFPINGEIQEDDILKSLFKERKLPRFKNKEITADRINREKRITVPQIMTISVSRRQISILKISIVDGHGEAGGLAGGQWGGIMERSSSAVEVISDWGPVGGLVGSMGGTILTSSATGSVKGHWYVGGLVGRQWSGLIEDCYATGSVAAVDEDWSYPLGGLVGGDQEADGNIRNCYATGSVETASASGGLVGTWGWDDDVNDDYPVEGVVENSYWNTETSGQAESAAGYGRTIADMTFPHAAGTYEGWDFTTVWRADEDGTVNKGYPYLRLPGDADHTLTYTAGAHGSIEGPAIQGVMDGEDGVEVRAVPDAGYRFIEWSDGRTDNPRMDENVTGSIAVTAGFQLMGDVNLNGRVDLGDAVLILRHTAGLVNLTDVQKRVGNITGHDDDDSIGIPDAIAIVCVLTGHTWIVD
jgi:hypothetical protein